MTVEAGNRDPVALIGLRVSVYWNVHRECVSLYAMTGPDRRVRHAEAVELDGTTFVVQAAGWRKVNTSGVKNVHAFVRGRLASVSPAPGYEQWPQAYYNPIRVDRWVERDSWQPVTSAARAVVTHRTVFFLPRPSRR